MPKLMIELTVTDVETDPYYRKYIQHVCSVLDIYVFVNSKALNQIDRQPIFIVLPPTFIPVRIISRVLFTKVSGIIFI